MLTAIQVEVLRNAEDHRGPIHRVFMRGSEYERAFSELVECENALRETLLPDASEALAAYAQAYANLSSISSFENHGISFRMVAQMAMERFLRFFFALTRRVTYDA